MPAQQDNPYSPPRRHPRVPMRCRIDLKTMSWPYLTDAHGRDVSYGGICIELGHPVRRGDRFVFVLELADGRSRRLVAEVRYAAPDGRVGLSWIDLDPDTRAALRWFVDGLAKAA